MWSAQPNILTEVTIMLDGNVETNPGVKDLPWLWIEPQSPSSQSDAITIGQRRPRCWPQTHKVFWMYGKVSKFVHRVEIKNLLISWKFH